MDNNFTEWSHKLAIQGRILTRQQLFKKRLSSLYSSAIKSLLTDKIDDSDNIKAELLRYGSVVLNKSWKGTAKHKIDA